MDYLKLHHISAPGSIATASIGIGFRMTQAGQLEFKTGPERAHCLSGRLVLDEPGRFIWRKPDEPWPGEWIFTELTMAAFEQDIRPHLLGQTIPRFYADIDFHEWWRRQLLRGT